MPDLIHIRRLRVLSHIGVPDAERAEPQALWLSLELEPRRRFDEIEDLLTETVDYAEIAQRATEVASAKPRQLIEVLAADLCAAILPHPALRAIRVTVEKHILPETDAVEVTLFRQKSCQTGPSNP